MNIIQAQNPFFEKYSTPHGTVPFEKIKTEHYEPAIREGINRHNAEIDAITNNPEAATFANTVAAYEKSGELLNQVSTVFGNLLSAETNDDMQELAKSIMPLLSEHGNNITLNEKLFARIKAVYDQKDQANLTPEQSKLLEKVYNSFVRSGANLEGEAKEQYRALSKELSLLTLQFGENNLKETNDYKLVLTDPANYLFLRWDSRRNNFVCCAIVVFLFQLRTFQYSYLKFLERVCVYMYSPLLTCIRIKMCFSVMSVLLSVKGKK